MQVMHSLGLSLLDAWLIVKRARRGVCPMRDNRYELLKYERAIRGGTNSFDPPEAFLDA